MKWKFRHQRSRYTYLRLPPELPLLPKILMNGSRPTPGQRNATRFTRRPSPSRTGRAQLGLPSASGRQLPEPWCLHRPGPNTCSKGGLEEVMVPLLTLVVVVKCNGSCGSNTPDTAKASDGSKGSHGSYGGIRSKGSARSIGSNLAGLLLLPEAECGALDSGQPGNVVSNRSGK